jgi:subtilisin family serine protease/PKD repeat protein
MKKFILIGFAFLAISQISAQSIYQWYQDGVLIFQLDTDTKYDIHSKTYEVNLDEVAFLQDMRDIYGITEVSRILYYHPDPKLNHTFQVNFTEAQKIDAFIEEVAKYSFIEYAEKKELHVKSLTPNDLGANSSSGTGMWHLYRMQAQQAWDLSTGSASVVVAVTDDAIKTTHPDLAGKFVAGNDATDQNSTDPNPCGGNDGNHGTHVTGTIGAKSNNNTGVASIGFDVSIMPVKIGRCSDGSLTAGYEGLAWAANNGADVINMSWGGGGSSNFGQNTATAAYNQGAILVAAAGNDGSTSQLYPAAYTNVIAVASTNTSDARSSFSQYGTWIDISAPGSGILSTVATNNSYSRYDGTSMASPNVSGLLGLMKSYAPNASNTNLINCLYSSADPVTSNASQMGAGRINAFAALQCVSSFTLQTDAGITAIDAPASTICGSTFTPSLTLRNFGSNTITSLTINYTWGVVNSNYSWTGSLSSGQSQVVTLPIQSSAGSGNFTFTASANLSGDQNAANNSLSKAFILDPNGQVATLSLTTDCYGSETTWEIIDNTNSVVVSGGPYSDVTGGQTFTDSYCLPIGCYTFNIYDSYGDGLYGSQWTCTVNGNYSMTGANGGNLFQMTAANGDFGNGTSHNFCIINPSVNDDAGITEIVYPSGIICAGTFAPQVRIRNFGNNNITSATINYNVGGANQTFNWTGNLSTGQTQVVTLASITANSGNITLTASTLNPNGNTDQNSLNDQSQATFNVLSTSLGLPFTESFSTNSLTNGTWSLSNPDNDKTWEMLTVSGTTPGTTGAKMDFFNYAQSSQRDGLISPSLNFNGYTSINMTFEHAYRRFNQTTTDSLIVYVSTNCGTSWQRVLSAGEDASGSFATASTNTNSFNPAASTEWCMGTVGADCFAVDLSAFAGNEVLVKFEGFNSGTVGNNLYLDNINITGVGAPLDADFTSSTQSICAGASITFNDNSVGTITSQSWSFPGGTPSSSSAASPSISYNNTGIYNVTYTVNGAGGSDTETKTAYITVSASPTASISGNSSICLNSSTVLTANANAGSGSITTYQWYLNGTAVGSNTSTYSATSPGNYTVEVSNSNNCAVTSSALTLSLSALPTVSLTGSVDFCQGGFTTLTANASSPSGSITNYEWSNNNVVVSNGTSSTYDATQLGGYTVLVSNSFGCTTLSNVVNVINEIASPTVTISGGNIFCPSSTTVLTANANPGQGSVTSYQWLQNGVNVGANSSTYTVSNAGTYQVVVTSSSGCVGSSASYIITEASPFNADFVTTDAACGLSDGTATVSINGSSAGYSFSWSNNPSVNMSTMSNLAAGIYQVEVTNNSTGCSDSYDVQINNLAAPIIDSTYVNQATCLNGNLGSAEVFVSGGVGSYSYDWGPGMLNASSVINLTPGTYALEITDAAMCQATFGFTINNAIPPVLDTAIVGNSTCNGISNGSIDLFVSGGTGNYDFQWSNGQMNEDLLGLEAGIYSVSITDLTTSCTIMADVAVVNTFSLGNSLTVNDNSATQSNSSITAMASGGIAPYSYSWNSGALSGDFIDNLSGGQYDLTITDDNGCLTYDTASIGFVGINDIQSITEIKLYPNPTSSGAQLFLQLENENTVQLSILNPLGQQIWAKELNGFESGNVTLPTEALAGGVYLLQVIIEGERTILSFNKIN